MITVHLVVAEQQNLFEPIPMEKFDALTREELIEWIKVQQKVNDQLLKHVTRLTALDDELRERTFLIEENYVIIRNKFFGKSSEKEKGSPGEEKPRPEPKPRRLKVQLLSERYPDAARIERHVEFKDVPNCSCCGEKLKDSGMTEDSEYLTVIPKQYIIVEQKRHKYRCESCHADIKTAPLPPRVKPGSSYSDEMMVDVAMTKYCDLIPIGRYTKIAERSGIPDLPPQSLIETTHYIADFVKGAYALVREEIIAERVLKADETPHRMLEGDEKTNWHLWGFSSLTASYFEAHDTRSGDVASDFLKDSKCEFLVSDVYSGYGKAVRVANELRSAERLPLIHNIYCNAHARRRFKEAKERFPEDAQFFIDSYHEIYRLESTARDKPPDEILRIRKEMAPHFEKMKTRTMELSPAVSTKSSMGKAMSYLVGNFKELTAFLTNAALPIDNNGQERLLRNPVIGRKTWYGTHSTRGAETMAILFSLVESCKLNKINPRIYFKQLIEDLHQGKKPYTPATFKTH